MPELLAPAGDMEMLKAAIDAGADAIYFGIRGLNMRANSRSFTKDDLAEISSSCHEKGVKAYLALNTIIYEEELAFIKDILTAAKDAGIDSVICWDHSVISIAKELGMEFHISTQASISNSSSAEFYRSQGATRCVLAREVTLEELEILKRNTGMKIEIFAHGAMCLSESGRCFMSEHLYGMSANRGQCIQPCRRSYDIIDPETRKELHIEDNYVMSPKDLCTLSFLEKLVPYADALKIEGRGRSPEYVKIVVEAYKEALSLIDKGEYTQEKKEMLIEKVSQVYNRGFSSGFYMGRPVEEFTDSYGSKATRRKRYVGYVRNYYKRPKVAEVILEAGSVKRGDSLLIIGPTTGVIEHALSKMMVDDTEVESAGKGNTITFKTGVITRKNDKVYVWEMEKGEKTN